MMMVYLFNKLGCGVLWTGAAHPQHPTSPFFLRRYMMETLKVFTNKQFAFRQTNL
jgi:hypothetical protein